MQNFQNLIQTLQLSIFSWDYFCDFNKIKNNTFKVKIQLNILNSLIWERNIEQKFLKIIKEYPETREVLPILIAVRDFDKQILDRKTLEVWEVKYLFNTKKDFEDEDMLKFFNISWLKEVFENKYISNLNDYVFWIETWLDSNARKNRTGKLMEDLVGYFIKKLCNKNPWFEYKGQATVSFIKKEWNIEVKSDKLNRRFDFAIFDWNKNRLFLVEVNYYWWGWSKLKAVAWEFTELYNFMKKQNIPFYWITDWLGWNTAKRPLEDAYNKMDWNIYNIEMLKQNILDNLIK